MLDFMNWSLAFNSSVMLVSVVLAVPPFTLRAAEPVTPKIDFPDVPGFLTVVCDLHQHTAFSDGDVWPNIRVQEGLRNGIDVMAITDHLEYQPHIDDIPHPDRNRSFQIAAAAGEGKEILIVNGAEITRDMPPGHVNAVFIQDANRLLIDDPVEAFREANLQGAFVFWNHPAWERQARDGIARLTEMHEFLIEEGLLHGIEVVNEFSYSREALAIALEHNLTIMGTSDIHGLIDWTYYSKRGGHRPVTLVFASEKTPESVKEALIAGRTVVWFEEFLIGRKEWLRPLVRASLSVTSAGYLKDSSIHEFDFENRSDSVLSFYCQNSVSFRNLPDTFTLEPHSTRKVQVNTPEVGETVTLELEVLNAITGPDEHLTLRYSLAMEAERDLDAPVAHE